MAAAHALTGTVCGLALASLADLPWPVELAGVAVSTGAALLPDLDHPGSTAARGLGFITRLAARAIAAVSRLAYRLSRGPSDPHRPGSGHRLLTHTIPGALALAAAVAAITLGGQAAAVVALGLVVALGAAGAPIIGALFTAGVVLLVLTRIPNPETYVWWWALTAGGGCLAHLAGDMATPSGVPVLWPLRIDGRRWTPRGWPIRSRAGSWIERGIVVPLLIATALVGSWVVFDLGQLAAL